LSKNIDPTDAPVIGAPTVPSRRVTEADMTRDKLSTKAALDAMPKRSVRLVPAAKDQPNYETVQINGYTYQIKRGVEVQVPSLVYEILEEANLI
jgi:hypothetical protein